MKKQIVFTGGGTGGHVFPGLAVIEVLKQKGTETISWIGSSGGMEQGMVEKAGIPFYGIPSGKLRRYFSLRNFIDLFKILGGFFTALGLLKKLKPKLLFSKGGFVSVPPVLAASLLKIPVITHESDFDPGLATKINTPFAKTILTSFKETENYFKSRYRQKIQLAGNPIRTAFEKGDGAAGRRFTGCPEGRKMILVLGGSQGSKLINDGVARIADVLRDKYYIVHQMGDKWFQKSEKANYFTAPFFNKEMPDILAGADLVIGRAGSNTLWELAAAGIPSILIPLSTAHSRGDQIRNARLFKKLGAAEIVIEEEIEEKLLEILLNLLNNEEKMTEMKNAAKAVYRPGSAEKIADIILQQIQEK